MTHVFLLLFFFIYCWKGTGHFISAACCWARRPHAIVQRWCVCVLLLCVSPGARTRCGPFSAIVRLHSAASWLTGSTLINKKKSAPIVELCPLLQVMWLNIEMDLCQYLWIQGYTGYSMTSLLWRGDYHKQIYGCTYGCVIWLNNTADFKFKKILSAVGIRGKQVRLNNLQVNVLL